MNIESALKDPITQAYLLLFGSRCLSISYSMILRQYRGRGILPQMKKPFSPTSCFHHRPQTNIKGRGKTRQIYDTSFATLLQPPTAFSSGDFLSLGGVCSLMLNTALFQILGQSPLHPRETPCTQCAIQKGTAHIHPHVTARRTISSCLFRAWLPTTANLMVCTQKVNYHPPSPSYLGNDRPQAYPP